MWKSITCTSLKDRTQEAVNLAKKATELDPNNHVAFMLLSSAYNSNFEYAKAETTAEKCISMKPLPLFVWTVVWIGQNISSIGRKKLRYVCMLRVVQLQLLFCMLACMIGPCIFAMSHDVKKSKLLKSQKILRIYSRTPKTTSGIILDLS